MSREIFLSSKRDRVKGKGPDRNTLPNFHCIGSIDEEIQREILEIVECFKNIDDNYIDDHSISKFCDLKTRFPKNHKTLLLQKPMKDSDGMNEKDYTVFDKLKPNSTLKRFFKENYPKCYRARIALLPAQSQVNWHIDMNTSVSCRFHILIKNPNVVFEINRKGYIEKKSFQEKAIYFTNTAWSHRVLNPTNKKRISLLFDIEYDNVKNLLPAI